MCWLQKKHTLVSLLIIVNEGHTAGYYSLVSMCCIINVGFLSTTLRKTCLANEASLGCGFCDATLSDRLEHTMKNFRWIYNNTKNENNLWLYSTNESIQWNTHTRTTTHIHTVSGICMSTNKCWHADSDTETHFMKHSNSPWIFYLNSAQVLWLPAWWTVKAQIRKRFILTLTKLMTEIMCRFVLVLR